MLNTRAGMHRYLYSIFDIFFQMLSHCDNPLLNGKTGPAPCGAVLPGLLVPPEMAFPPPVFLGPSPAHLRTLKPTPPPGSIAGAPRIPLHGQNLQWKYRAVICLTVDPVWHIAYPVIVHQ
jgi:hypothetical protein